MKEKGQEAKGKQQAAFETDIWTTITAQQVICEFQKAKLAGRAGRAGRAVTSGLDNKLDKIQEVKMKELAAAVILRLNALVAEVATEFNLPAEYSEKNMELWLELAEKAGWA